MTETESENGLKVHNQEVPESDTIAYIRRLIVFIVALTVLGLGYPVLQFTTAIYRADLPVDEITSLASTLHNDISFKIPVYLDIPTTLDVFIPDSQEKLNQFVNSKYPELANFWSLDLKKITPGIDPEIDYVVKLVQDENENGDDAVDMSPFSKETTLKVSQNWIDSKLVDQVLSSVLVDMVFKEEISELVSIINNRAKELDKNIVVPYSPNYNLVFSLLVENGRTVKWDIETALKQMKPFLNKLTHYTNFSISTQVQYYSKTEKPVVFDEKKNAYILKESDLSTFINFGDWNLNTHDMDPSINFLVYFPESNYENKPWVIDHLDNGAFLVKQWGGVYIFNKEKPILEGYDVNITELELIPILEIFTSQLFQLLGLATFPKSPSMRVDTLTRLTLFKNLKKTLENLHSLVKLTVSLNEISIPDETKEHVLKSIELVKLAISEINQKQNYHNSMTISSKALTISDRAFFDKEMVQQAYFPNEHKMAVFLPLLGPVTSILAIALIKILVSFKTGLKKKKAD
ncbi:hypothetical protein G9P44_002483 [Scheffersomyces stipitis]|nr:hypothetical protein G9P44_002483 [Scheffersomyces stipitis]